MGTSHQNVKQIVRRLEDKGFVVIQRDPADRRSYRLQVTDKAAAYDAAQQPRNDAFVQGVFEGLSAEQVAALAAAMEHIDGNLARMQRDLQEETNP